MPVAVVVETGHSTAFWALFYLAQIEPAEVSLRFVLRSKVNSSPNEVRLVCQMLRLIFLPFFDSSQGFSSGGRTVLPVIGDRTAKQLQ
ncbi:hypothetical protein AVEN_128518-1 [Araneus ventricosus]|uniref:Uncharacterized protein n=1 Tax=Araneus ventricosus TaxID=182803 RepID=A0A4Y2HNB5_ARAVE|nr:hypothetical protein AVEN_128518-1 [Araneus ventricosus]